MSMEKKTGVFYELMIRGNWDPQKGPLGAVTTYQLQTGTAIVDTDSNTLAAPFAADPAVDLTKEQAVAFLDEKMAGFLDQLATERKAAEAAASDQTKKHNEAVRDLNEKLEAKSTAYDDLKQRASAALGHLTSGSDHKLN